MMKNRSASVAVSAVVLFFAVFDANAMLSSAPLYQVSGVDLGNDNTLLEISIDAGHGKKAYYLSVQEWEEYLKENLIENEDSDARNKVLNAIEAYRKEAAKAQEQSLFRINTALEQRKETLIAGVKAEVEKFPDEVKKRVRRDENSVDVNQLLSYMLDFNAQQNLRSGEKLNFIEGLEELQRKFRVLTVSANMKVDDTKSTVSQQPEETGVLEAEASLKAEFSSQLRSHPPKASSQQRGPLKMPDQSLQDIIPQQSSFKKDSYFTSSTLFKIGIALAAAAYGYARYQGLTQPFELALLKMLAAPSKSAAPEPSEIAAPGPGEEEDEELSGEESEEDEE